MLELAGILADDEFHILRLADGFETAGEFPAYGVQGAPGDAGAKRAAEPLAPGGEGFDPVVGGGDGQKAADGQVAVNAGEESAGIRKAVDEVGGEHQVEVAELLVEVLGVPLVKIDAGGGLFQTEIGEADVTVGDEVPFVEDLIAEMAVLLQQAGDVDETGREVDGGDMVEAPRQLKGGAPDGAPQIEGPAPGAFCRIGAEPRQPRRKVGDAKFVGAVVGVAVLREGGVGMVAGIGGRKGGFVGASQQMGWIDHRVLPGWYGCPARQFRPAEALKRYSDSARMCRQ